MVFDRGTVVWGPEPFKGINKPRPWLIISNEDHPFYGEEYLAITLTTTERKEALEIEQKNWIKGRAPKDSFAAPWVVITLKHEDIEEKIGKLSQGFVDKVIEKLKNYIQ